MGNRVLAVIAGVLALFIVLALLVGVGLNRPSAKPTATPPQTPIVVNVNVPPAVQAAPVPAAQPPVINVTVVMPTQPPVPTPVPPTPVPSPTPTPTPTGTPIPVQPPAPSGQPALSNPGQLITGTSSITGTCSFPVPSADLNSWSKTMIELAPQGQWFHRVYNARLFNATNNWGGADSWYASLAIGPYSGGSWTSHGNPGQVVYRATNTSISWCLGVLTTATWKSQFMDNSSTMPAAINIRITPNTAITVVTKSGKTITQATSDAGDITVVLPDSGVVTISVAYTTAAPTHESLVWWGPYDRSQAINTIDARQ